MGYIVRNHTFVRMLVVMQILFGVILILRVAPDSGRSQRRGFDAGKHVSETEI